MTEKKKKVRQKKMIDTMHEFAAHRVTPTLVTPLVF